jgi:aspartate aminotransferase-like enzyme
MAALLPDVDPDGLLEYSVVYTDRTLNHMSKRFQGVMRDVSATLKQVYGAHSAIVVPGSGTFGMEAVARQFAHGKRCLVVRNGWFSYRWSQIFEMGRIPAESMVLRARRVGEHRQSPFVPPPIEEVVATIRGQRPDLVFAPHVETASGMMLPDGYLREIGTAVREAGGLFVLDCVASGAVWIDMTAVGVDILVTAPQKGWSGTPCCGLVMLGERARERIEGTTSSSFACDLRKWLQVMETYEGGGHMYYATPPTDGLAQLRDVMAEAREHGYEKLRSRQLELGRIVRSLLARKGFPSVAAPGYEAPAVIVSYTDDPGIQSGSKFVAVGLQVAAGVPLQCDEGPDFRTFRIGLFGLDKLRDVDGTARRLERALDALGRQ